MRRGRIVDTTAETVAGNSLGDAVLSSVLSRIEGGRERTVFLAHVALGLPVPAVARAFGLDLKEVDDTVKSLLRKLRSDKTLTAQLSDVRRAGRPEHYLILAEKLNLQDWLCARCGQPMVQPKVGRPRKTCSDSCRVALSLADGRGWKDPKDWAASPHAASRDVSPGEEMRRRAALVLTSQETDVMRSLLRKIVKRDSRWWYTTRDYTARNKALLLLGFTCLVQLSAKDLAILSLDDARLTGKGLELRLNWGKGNARIRQYVTMSSDRDSDLCPVQALRAWQSVLYNAGCRNGPLFPRLAHWDALKSERPGMGARAVLSEIGSAMDAANLPPRGLSESALLPNFLKDVAASRINMRVSDGRQFFGRS